MCSGALFGASFGRWTTNSTPSLRPFQPLARSFHPVNRRHLYAAKTSIMKALKLETTLEDMLLTLGDQIHLIKLVSPTSFVYLVADRSQANLAIVRNGVNKHALALG